jgi:hemoglobin
VPLGPTNTPYDALGGEAKVRALVESFYDAMSDHEPALAKLHKCDEQGRVSRESRDRFALFLIAWLGGPQTYMEQHGHPRLRMRHGHVAIDTAMRDAWMRSMTRALDAQGVTGELREFLDAKLGDVATFLRNQPG